MNNNIILTIFQGKGSLSLAILLLKVAKNCLAVHIEKWFPKKNFIWYAAAAVLNCKVSCFECLKTIISTLQRTYFIHTSYSIFIKTITSNLKSNESTCQQIIYFQLCCKSLKSENKTSDNSQDNKFSTMVPFVSLLYSKRSFI